MANQSLELGRAWDDTFNGWTGELLLGRKYQKPRRAPAARSSWSGMSVASSAVPDYAGKGSKADIRGRLLGIAKGGQQVMVKITPGKNHSIRAVRKHLQYIGEDGEGVVYDQNGNEYQGKAAVDEVVWAWQHVGPTMPEAAEARLAFNIVFSMPEGSDERALFAAVKATAENEFAGHQWVMGQHFDQPHVHCHVSVKAEGMNGVRLNPRKADLQRWRERFAHELRERGVEAEATRRITRLRQTKINKPWAVTRLEERGAPTSARKAPDPARVSAWTTSFQKSSKTYGDVIDALARSPDVDDRSVAQTLAQMQVEQSKAAPVPVRKAPELER